MTNCLQTACLAVEATDTAFTDCWLELEGTLVDLTGLEGLLERG